MLVDLPVPNRMVASSLAWVYFELGHGDSCRILERKVKQSYQCQLVSQHMEQIDEQVDPLGNWTEFRVSVVKALSAFASEMSL